jgi:hypothetical protein
VNPDVGAEAVMTDFQRAWDDAERRAATARGAPMSAEQQRDKIISLLETAQKLSIERAIDEARAIAVDPRIGHEP